MFSRGDSLLPSIYADARCIDTVIVSQAGAYFVFSCKDCAAPQGHNGTWTASGWLQSDSHEADDAFGPLFSNPVSNTSGVQCDHATYMFSKVIVIAGLVGYGLLTLLLCCVCCSASGRASSYELIN